jgi:hypothetical protein
MKIKKLRTSNLRNEEHFQFQTEFKDLANQFTPATLGIVNEYMAYEPLYYNESQALDVIRKSSITDDLADADMKRDSTFRGLADAVKAGNNHFNPTVKQAAARVQVVFDFYGNIATKPYDEETAAINNLITELNGTYANDAVALGINEWLIELKANNDAFDSLKKNRYSEGASKTQLRMKQVRMEVDAAYKTISERINAFIIINGPSAYEIFVNELNQRVGKYNILIAQRKGRNSKDETPEETKQ